MKVTNLMTLVFILGTSAPQLWAKGPGYSGSAACMGGGFDGSEDKMEKRVNRFMEGLNLSEETQKEIQGVLSSAKVQRADLRKQLQEAQTSFHDSMAKRTPNDAAVLKQKYEKILELRTSMGRLHFETMTDIRSKLTDEQLSEFFEKMHSKRFGRNRSSL